MSDFRQRNILLRTFVCVVIVCIVYGAEVKIEHDVMKAVQRIQEFTDANTKSQYQRPISTLFQDSHSDVIARAEELLQNGIQDSKLNVTSTCQNHTEMFLSALAGGQQWALRMIDAIGKPPSDILDYKYVWLGSYDECVAIEAAVNISGVITSPFKGRYCKAYFKLGETQPSPFNPTGEVDLTVGVCVPNSCNGEDTVHLLNISLFNRTVLPAPTHVECQYESLEYTPKAIVVMVICSIFGLVLIVATLYDIIMIQWLGNSSKEMKHYEILKENYEPLANSRTGNSYGATDSATPLPVNAHDITVNNQADVNIGHKKQGEYQQPGKLARILLSFSIYTNASKILTVNQPPGTLTAVHGIRFISMTWVILGHTYVFGITTGDNLLPFATKMMKRFTFQAILNGLLSVDTFFTLSGLLVAYLSLKEMKKRSGALKFRWGMFYFHRFWRLTPPYMLFMMFYIPLIKYWSNGPLWSQKGVEVNECEDTWWKNLLYVNNLVDPAHMCMGWAWYLANDMQFFIVSPLMLIPLFYSPLLGGLSCGVFVLVNFISTGVISARDHLGPGFLSNTNGFIDIYIKPWCRIGPYAVGCLAGYILYKTECKIRIPKIVNLFGWAVATAVALLTVYGLYDSSGQPHLSNSVSAFYNATHRTAWALAVSWVIIACATGNGGWVNTFLSWKPFIPLSRLTYCAYLVHPVVMEVYYMSRRTLVYYTDMEVSYLFCGHLCLSYAVAFLVSLAFESPMMGLEKVLLGREKNS